MKQYSEQYSEQTNCRQDNMEAHKQSIEQMLRILEIEEWRRNKQIHRKQERKLRKVKLQLARMTASNEMTKETAKKKERWCQILQSRSNCVQLWKQERKQTISKTKGRKQPSKKVRNQASIQGNCMKSCRDRSMSTSNKRAEIRATMEAKTLGGNCWGVELAKCSVFLTFRPGKEPSKLWEFLELRKKES